MPWQLSVVLGFILALSHSLLVVLLCRLILDRRITGGRASKYTLLEAYARAYHRFRAYLRPFLIVQALIWLTVFFFTTFPSAFIVTPGLTICIAGIAGFLVLLIFQVIYGIVIGRYALANILTIRVTVGEVLARSLKQGLYAYLSLLVVVEAIGIFILLNSIFSNMIWLFGVTIAIFAAVLGPVVFGGYIHRWIYRAVPVEQSQWSALGERVQQWAALAEVRFHGIYVQHETSLYTQGTAISGMWRTSLFLSDLFLEYSDWRQQDAIITDVLSLLAQHPFRYLLLSRFFLSLFLVLVIFMLTQAIALFPAFALLIFLIAVALLIAFLLSWQANLRKITSHYFLADAQTMAMTGDPLALIVALNTLAALNPHTAALGMRRIQRLEKQMQRPGPRAPWAMSQVPSIVPVVRESRTFTMPIDQISLPAPVPATPYPITESGFLSLFGSDSQNYERFEWN